MRFPWLSRQLWCVRRRIPIAPIGLDAPTPARVVGLPPRGGSTFFRSERKYQRKPAARRLQRRPTSLCAVGFGLREPNGWMPRIYSGHPIPALRPEQSDHVPWADCPQGLSSTSARCAHPPGKRLLLPILTAGLAMSRAMKLASLPIRAERARARLFPPSKWAGLFPSAAYRRSAPPQVALGRLKGKPVGMLRRDLAGFAAQKNGFDFFFCGWHYPYTKSAAWDASPRLEYSCNTKGQHDFKSTLAFLASHEARRRMAVFTRQ